MEREILQYLKDNESEELVSINSLLLEIVGQNDNNAIRSFLQDLYDKQYIETGTITLFGATLNGEENNLNTYNLKAKIRPKGKERLKQIYSEAKFDSVEDLELAILSTISAGKGNIRQTVYTELKKQSGFRILNEGIFDKIWNDLLDTKCLLQGTLSDIREVQINKDNNCIDYYTSVKEKRDKKSKEQEEIERLKNGLTKAQVENANSERLPKKYWWLVIILSALLTAALAYIIKTITS